MAAPIFLERCAYNRGMERSKSGTGVLGTRAIVACKTIVASLIVLTAVFVVYESISDYYFVTHRADEVMREFGFEIVDANAKANGDYLDAVALGHFQAGGAMYRAGFREGDILLDYRWGWTARKFVRMLDTHRGDEIAVKVVDSGDGPPLAERPARTIRLRIPERAAP